MTDILGIVMVTLALVGLGLVESRQHKANIGCVPKRVHVNGTRGKSTVVRLIAAGLREGGVRTVAKTTGTSPRLILPTGEEHMVHRAYRANIMEQYDIVAIAAAYGAEVLVVECMALRPDLQAISELTYTKSTHGVITNVGPDHLEIMGPTERDVALSLAGTVPVGGRLFTAEDRYLAVFERAAADRGSVVTHVGPEERGQIHPELLTGFDHVEHGENLALALAVCKDLGVERDIALRGMWRSRPDPGAMTIHEVEIEGRKIIFVNAFAANDPQSSEWAWNLALNRFPEASPRVVLVNCRSDRPHRSRALGQACPAWSHVDYLLVIGACRRAFTNMARSRGLPPDRVIACPLNDPRAVIKHLSTGRVPMLVVGIGNAQRGGLTFVETLVDDLEKRIDT